ncbi:MAG TPA: adenylate/guanylate cyclase domain-containing protein [Nitrososphaerales archaeon]|nr:adenylate/guanylate cyclase domain-containing protein [Nitrososphaerales archaeon]
MTSGEGERRLIAIMYTDMIGYTSLGQRNESLSLALVEEQRKLIRPILARHNGREVKTMGDAFLVEFPNATDSVRCAYDIQRTIREFNFSLATDKRIHLRIGVHLGEVTEAQGDISGDAVNVASRIYPLAEDGGVCVTKTVYDFVRGKVDIPVSSIGAKTLKNVSEPMEVYKMEMPWEPPTSGGETSYPSNRIAILPFVSMSTNPDDAFFADGVTEEIISTVSGISGLSVISRTSVMGYKGTTKKAKEIGKELEVGSILEGSFRKAGNRIRVTTQLIDVAADRHLWTQNYDRNLDDVFEVQSDVARQVADALRVRILSPEKERIERKPTESTTAYSLYLKGKHHLNVRGLEDLRKAREYFELAVHEDPEFALGYLGVSDCCLVLRSNWWDEPEPNLEKARTMLDKALQLDSELAEAHATKGLFLSHLYDLQGAENEFRKALELKPSYATAHMWYFLLLFHQLRWQEAQREIEMAVELDPLALVVYGNLGAYYFYKKDFGRAIESWTKTVDLGSTISHGGLAEAYGLMGRFEDMKREFDIYVRLNKDSVPLAQLYAEIWTAYLMDDKKTVARLLPELEAHYHDERGPSAHEIGSVCFYLGEEERGFEWLERSFAKKEPGLLYIKSEQFLFFDGVRSDPRYLDLLKRLGLD